MDAASLIETLTPLVPGAAYEAGAGVDGASVRVPASHLVATCRALRDTPALSYNVLVELTAVDYLPQDPRFEVVYHLLSIPHRTRLRLRVRVGLGDAVPSVQAVWPAAGWPEREVYDMFGIEFDGHPDLRRLLMPEDWDGHPARKDYPVQLKKAAQTYSPLEISKEEFRANIERDRVRRPQ